MKHKSFLHLALLRKAMLCFCFLALTFQSRAQTGSSCVLATTLMMDNAAAVIQSQINQNEWYAFVAQSSAIQISAVELSTLPATKLHSIELLSGICGSQTLIASDSSISTGDSILTINSSGLTIGNTYFIRINKAVATPMVARYFFLFDTFEAGGCTGCMDAPANSCNLVCNGDAEYYWTLPSATTTAYPGYLNRACPWMPASQGSSDYFNAALPAGAVVDVPSNFQGYQNASSGGGYAGVFAYCTNSVPNYHEYLYQELKCGLIAGVQYELTYHVSLAGRSNRAVSSLGAYLTPTNPYSATTGNIPIPAGSTAFPAGMGFISDTTNWTTITTTFIANGTERYLVLGDFGSSNPANVDSINANPSVFGKFAYYYYDDISITPINNLAINATDTLACPYQSVLLGSNTAALLDWQPAAYMDCNFCESPIVSVPASTDVTATITYCTGCTYTDTIHIETFTPTANAGADITICPGTGGTDLTATGGGNYTWSNGETTATIHVNPPVTTTYTVTVTDTEGCGTTATDQVTVFVTSPTTTATASPVIIPYGCSSTLSATSSMGGLTYTWMPETLSGSSVTASPTSTTTYTVTGSSPDGGCYSTATVTVQVVNNPFVVNGNTSACAGLSTYGVSSVIPGVSYSWSTSTGLSGTGTTASVDFNLTGGGTITFTADFGSGCIYSESLVVGACCNVTSGIPSFYNAVASSDLAPYGVISSGAIVIINQTFAINGTFIVDQDLLLKGCDLRMGYLAQIVLKPGVTFKISS